MKLRTKSIFAVIIALFFLASGLIQAQVTLKAGDPAPAIKHSKWFKGTPVNAFEKGKIYVVEFWATWCGPCKQSIPHLTELAHKYKDKVTIIGMDGSERPKPGEDANKLVEDFLKEMGDKMDYNVAMDTPDKFMMNNWMTAAAQFGIPTAFIVDKETKIAWIGHPMSMDEPLAQIVEGKFDVKAFAEKFTAQQEKAAKDAADRKKFNEVAKPVLDAYKAKDWGKVISECEAIVAKDASMQSRLDSYYFRALALNNPDKAMQLANAERAKRSDRLTAINQAFLQKDIDKKFINFAVEVNAEDLAKDANDYNAMVMLSSGYELLGNNAKAIEMVEKMIAYAKANGAGDSYFKSMNERIEKLKAAK